MESNSQPMSLSEAIIESISRHVQAEDPLEKGEPPALEVVIPRSSVSELPPLSGSFLRAVREALATYSGRGSSQYVLEVV